ncbi:MAG TPA: glycosyltransferase, partial [Salinimicrobium sp.]|nr:glycosyltransferase [Salinimicrobium sp.]
TGKNFIHLHRKDRKGFKAGALKEGLETAKGEFIAIFDADFLPEKDWLLKTIAYFKDEKIGVVQTRWGHLNRNFSLLTKIQAFALDYHFILEQNGRSNGDHFINFNGTAGIWRKKCILDSGNWQGNTLTEDLDLSYRAQLKNWKFKYLENVETPAELPITLAAARSQQFRWNKGAAENFQKNFKKVIFDPKIGFGTKIHGFFHLLNSSLFLIILMLAILSVPVLFLLNSREGDYFLYIISFFSLSSLIFFICFWLTFPDEKSATKTASFLKFIPRIISFFSIAMGFSVHNSQAVLEGHFGKKSDFIRTPKFNISENSKYKNPKRAFLEEIPGTFFIELILLAYFCFGIYSAFHLDNFSMILFHLMLVFGFGFIIFKSVFK